MKKVLITGKSSYIGQSVKKWIKSRHEDYQVEAISLRDEWQSYDFSRYDSIIHTVGIAHVDSNPDPKMKKKYYRVNKDLAIEVAEKAKKDGVTQFIFLSSIIVYGNVASLNESKTITQATKPKPKNFYGDSKYQAEKMLYLLNEQDFKVAILRLPMVYGKNSKGNYSKLSKLAINSPVFPDINNRRSMIHIDNLSEFIYLLIKNVDQGYFYPQNSEYVTTSRMVQSISHYHGKYIKLVKVFNPLLRILSSRLEVINKVFGDLAYDLELSTYKEDYRVRTFLESVKETEK